MRQSATGKHDGQQTKPQILNWTETCDKKNQHRIIDVNNDEIFFQFLHPTTKEKMKIDDQYTDDYDNDRNISDSVHHSAHVVVVCFQLVHGHLS